MDEDDLVRLWGETKRKCRDTDLDFDEEWDRALRAHTIRERMRGLLERGRAKVSAAERDRE